jgi:hypothetical protein
VNRRILVDDHGRPRAARQLILNFFPDVSYVTVIKLFSRSDGYYSWTGRLKGFKYSSATLTYASGVFAGNFAKPGAVYEVSLVRDDLYRVVLIDPSQFEAPD